MSELSPSVFPITKRSRGRIPHWEIPSERTRHLRALAIRKLMKAPLMYIAAMPEVSGGKRVSRRTIQRWIISASAYPEAASDELLREFLPKLPA